MCGGIVAANYASFVVESDDYLQPVLVWSLDGWGPLEPCRDATSTAAFTWLTSATWVEPLMRVGEALIREVIAWATATGAAAVTLSVKTTNSHAASLYRRMGFAPTYEPADAGEERMQLTLD